MNLALTEMEAVVPHLLPVPVENHQLHAQLVRLGPLGSTGGMFVVVFRRGVLPALA